MCFLTMDYEFIFYWSLSKGILWRPEYEPFERFEFVSTRQLRTALISFIDLGLPKICKLYKFEPQIYKKQAYGLKFSGKRVFKFVLFLHPELRSMYHCKQIYLSSSLLVDFFSISPFLWLCIPVKNYWEISFQTPNLAPQKARHSFLP